MLNRKLLAIATTVGLITFGGISSNVFATDLTTATAGATIVAPLSIAQNAGLNFGDISPDGDNATTVTVDTAGAVTQTGGAGIAGGAPAAGQFTVTGFGTLAIAVSFTGGTITCGACGGAPMAVSGFTDNAAGALVGGTEQFEVGADLAVGAGQTAGTYSGTYTVTVVYN